MVIPAASAGADVVFGADYEGMNVNMGGKLVPGFETHAVASYAFLIPLTDAQSDEAWNFMFEHIDLYESAMSPEDMIELEQIQQIRMNNQETTVKGKKHF